MTFGLSKTKVHSTRHYRQVMAFAVVLVGLLLGVRHYATEYLFEGNTDQLEIIHVATSTFARSNPVRLQIPSLAIDTTFVLPLGLQTDQTVAVPDSYEQVGWYEGGATPGEIGPAVILGHVDSLDGPAIFYSLGQLKIGEEIIVTRDDGSVATFVVTKLQRYPQSNFPTLDVYGPTKTPTLRLVTCSGIFDKGEQRYSHNLVVYAEIKE